MRTHGASQGRSAPGLQDDLGCGAMTKGFAGRGVTGRGPGSGSAYDTDPVLAQLVRAVDESGQARVPVTVAAHGMVVSGLLISQDAYFAALAEASPRHGKEALIMLMRTDPFRELDRITQQVFGTAARPAAMPMDAYRHGDEFYVHFDLPGIDPDSISLTVEQNVLNVRAERAPAQPDGAELLIAERPYGTYTRQVFLGETLDADKVAADYAAGVLTPTIPVHEAAKPRNIRVTSSDQKQAVNA